MSTLIIFHTFSQHLNNSPLSDFIIVQTAPISSGVLIITWAFPCQIFLSILLSLIIHTPLHTHCVTPYYLPFLRAIKHNFLDLICPLFPNKLSEL